MLKKYFSLFLLVIICVQFTVQDIFMSNPRGSNNRLNENKNNRNNNNRIFNSQNNNNGGYNVGDRTSAAAQTEDDQYSMRYFQSGTKGGSFLTIEWTNQHGCGGTADAHCNQIIQYLCDNSNNAEDRLRDGLNTNSQDYTDMTNDTKQAHAERKKANVVLDRGLHETWQYYDKCKYRERNLNLFTADQGLKKNEKGYSGAIYTRQNRNGGRSGYECDEERDYYPYFHPHPWKDIAILTNDVSHCEKIYKGNSFNVKPLHECVEFYENGEQKHWSRWNNKEACEKNKGKWTEFYNYLEKATEFKVEALCEAQNNKTGNSNIKYKWALPYDSENINNKECLVLLNEPECKKAEPTRHNHLGNTADGNASRYTWRLPYFPSKTPQKCIIRIRYNISTNDYDGYNTDSKSNKIGNKQQSPIQNNPLIDLSKAGSNKPIKIRMAINTAQFGRTFQDRSHAFYLIPRGKDIPDQATVYNLNVRGKRGNIVQVYPGVEYDFLPYELKLRTTDYVHIQWTGSNSNPNNAGQGAGNTDRSNILEIKEINVNYPIPLEQSIKGLWSNVQVVGILDDKQINVRTKRGTFFKRNSSRADDLALYFATSAYYDCYDAATCGADSAETKTTVDQELNTAPASVPGAVIKFINGNKTYYYMSSRNNAFSNRAQKGKIVVQ